MPEKVSNMSIMSIMHSTTAKEWSTMTEYTVVVADKHEASIDLEYTYHERCKSV